MQVQREENLEKKVHKDQQEDKEAYNNKDEDHNREGDEEEDKFRGELNENKFSFEVVENPACDKSDLAVLTATQKENQDEFSSVASFLVAAFSATMPGETYDLTIVSYRKMRLGRFGKLVLPFTVLMIQTGFRAWVILVLWLVCALISTSGCQ